MAAAIIRDSIRAKHCQLDEYTDMKNLNFESINDGVSDLMDFSLNLQPTTMYVRNVNLLFPIASYLLADPRSFISNLMLSLSFMFTKSMSPKLLSIYYVV